MYHLFKFYGPAFFRDYILPEIKPIMDFDFEDVEYAYLCKIIAFDVISAFIRTSKYYYNSYGELYNECMMIMHELYDEGTSNEIKKLYRQSIRQCFKNRDPLRAESAIQLLIDQLPSSSLKVTQKNVELIASYGIAFNWKSLPILAKCVEKYLDWDPQEIKIASTFSDEIPPYLRLVYSKNWPEFQFIVMLIYHMTLEVCKVKDSEIISKIEQYIYKIIEEIKNFDNSGETNTLIFNTSLVSLANFFTELYSRKVHKSVDIEFIKIIFDITFIAKDKKATSDTVDELIYWIGIFLANNNSYELVESLAEYVLEYSTHENWKLRENALLIYDIWKTTNKGYKIEENFNFSKLEPLFVEENVYVMKQLRDCLETWIWNNPAIMKEIGGNYTKIVTDQIKKLKELRNSNGDIKPIMQDLNASVSILLAVCNGSKYILEDWNVNLYLFLSKIIPHLTIIKSEVVKFFQLFKQIHQKLVIFQEGKYEPIMLENLKEIFTINCELCMS